MLFQSGETYESRAMLQLLGVRYPRNLQVAWITLYSQLRLQVVQPYHYRHPQIRTFNANICFPALKEASNLCTIPLAKRTEQLTMDGL
jgi:hypothetical protein